MGSIDVTVTAQPSPRLAEGAHPLSAPGDAARHRARERRRAIGGAVRRGLLAGAIVAGAVGVVLALRPKPVPVDVARARRGELVVAVEESGMTRVKDRYVVS